jgi:hypothetical protein
VTLPQGLTVAGKLLESHRDSGIYTDTVTICSDGPFKAVEVAGPGRAASESRHSPAPVLHGQ